MRARSPVAIYQQPIEEWPVCQHPPAGCRACWPYEAHPHECGPGHQAGRVPAQSPSPRNSQLLAFGAIGADAQPCSSRKFRESPTSLRAVLRQPGGSWNLSPRAARRQASARPAGLADDRVSSRDDGSAVLTAATSTSPAVCALLSAAPWPEHPVRFPYTGALDGGLAGTAVVQACRQPLQRANHL